MKKVLMVATVASMIGSFNLDNLSILQKMGYEVHVACNFKDRTVWTDEKVKKLVKQLKDMGVKYHQIDFHRKPSHICSIVKAYRQLNLLVKKNKFHFIHCHTPVGGLVGRIVSHRNHVKVIYTAHGFHFFNGAPLRNWLLYYPVEKFLSRWTDILVTINSEDYMRAKAKFKARKTYHIHGVGIELEQFKTSDMNRETKRKELGLSVDNTMLFSIGELDKEKNHILVIQAMKELSKEGCKYYIAGKGKLLDELKQITESEKLTDSVIFLGYRQDITDLLKASDVFVFPSLFEGLSVALMEAVAAKLPIACSNVRGNTDTVVTPLSYFDKNSVGELVHVIRQIMNSDMNNMTEENYANLMKYQLANVRKEMLEIYKLAGCFI
ncbi:glycosyltransferase [Lachnospiraceae bacterium WCA-9-b2]|uniref:Glycosyltransferase n=1 Tax=Sporofaciens musculi TaxID=2681861 RepID=A0A7X3MEG5_9FIRM|nr:glycosyltransferase [Sporofaciens musculi]MXP74777.1 glycosyltransferase [Sporofaciens musculi]